MTDPTPLPSRIGPYPIEREVGRGGMGIVYLGRNTRLDRPVAIKVLPEAFASDPERLARFEREARLLASLTHPNIAGIYGLEEAGGRRFLVLEYVEGETLAQRIARGPLPADDAIDVCRQIAAALEAAHEGGVIHRDLKPGNVKLTPSGEVKVLDFGLAKSGTGTAASSDPSITASPTMALTAATGVGVILGTAAYMSPEQARGRVVDRRTDIWSFGCVLFECLAGRMAFAGETVSDMIALILQGEPDWKALPDSTPPRLRDLIARCLTKDARKRLRDIGEARLVLEGGDLAPVSGVGLVTASPAAPVRTALPWVLASVFALAAAELGALLATRGPEPAPVQRLSLAVPPMPVNPREAAFAALSPDGTMLASCGADSGGNAALWLRPLDALDGRFLPGTEDGALPFWSPDGRYVAFATQDKLKKLDLRGGSPEVLCPVTSYGRGGSWGTRGVIVFSAGAEGPIYKVSQDGGTPEPATTLDSAETGHRFPRFLPDGQQFLFAAMPPLQSQYAIYVGSIDSPRREKLMTADGTPVFVEPGYLLFGRNGRIVAQRFDPASRTLSGEPIPLVDEPQRTIYLGSPSLLAAPRGPLAYFRNLPAMARLVWLNAEGDQVGALPTPAGTYEKLALSPDGARAMVVRTTSAVASDLWMVDLERGVMTRFTFGPGRVDRPVWSPDGSRIAFSSDRGGRWDLYEKSAGGAGAETPLLESGSLLKYPSAYTPDGSSLVFEQIGERTGWDVWVLPLAGDRTPRPLLVTPYDEVGATLSRDGRWLAYDSNESGRSEVYVQDFPEPKGKHAITTTGATGANWRADGRGLLHFGPGGVTRVEVDPGAGFRTGVSRTHSLRPELIFAVPDANLDRALAIVRAGGVDRTDDLTLVLGWRSELKPR